jgi:hypothetical protein
MKKVSIAIDRKVYEERIGQTDVPHTRRSRLDPRPNKRFASHLQHPDSRHIIVVHVHGNQDLKPGTQRGIMNDADLSEDDLQ